MDKEQALQSFIESFYSNTELSRSAAAAMDQSGSSSVPLMITGEIGTGKDRVAYLHYAKSQFNDEPLYVVNCSMLNDKTWNFLINHYNSPFTDNGNTITSPIWAFCPTRGRNSCYLSYWTPTCISATV